MGKTQQNDQPSVPVQLYEGDDCPLCHEAKQRIAQYATRYPVDLTITDIESDPELHEEYRYSIPVVFVDGTLASKGELNERRFERLLRESTGKKRGDRS